MTKTPFRSGLEPRWWMVATIYSLLTVVTVLSWSHRGVYTFTGDEPHYMVVSDALVSDGTVDVREAYLREFRQPTFYPFGLSTESLGGSIAELTPPSAHVVETPGGGLASWHGVGLSLMASPLVALAPGNVEVIRLGAAVAGLLILGLLWQLTSALGWQGWSRLYVVAAVGLAYPVLTASTQLFPDVWAGTFLLAGLTWLVSSRLRASGSATVAIASLIGFTPWLGMRFALAAAIAGVAMVGTSWRLGRPRFLAALVPIAVLGIGLVLFNTRIFGSVLGAPTDGTLAWGAEFWMLLPGLLLDQDQGALFFHPLLWCGLLGVAVMWRTHRLLSFAWLGIMLALWVPAAAHPGLYGLGGFIGRYSWSIALVMMVPALIFLRYAWDRWHLIMAVLLGASLVFQLYVWVLASFIGGTAPGSAVAWDLYTRPTETWLESYAAWWFPIQGLFPAFYNTSWAWSFGPSLLWVVVAVCVVAVGFFVARGSAGAVSAEGHPTGKSRALVMLATLVLAIVCVGWISVPGPRAVSQPDEVSLSPGVEVAQYVSQGPDQLMRLGTYTWWVTYAADGEMPVGKWELVEVASDSVVAAGELKGTSGEMTSIGHSVEFRSFQPKEYLLRVGWYGAARMTLKETGVRHGA